MQLSDRYSYKIMYKSINKMFLLEDPDMVSHLFVISLDPPVRQGQTNYPYLIIKFQDKYDTEVTLEMDE